MNILLWIIQGLLALHTAIGAVWKFSNSTAVVPSLSAIPQGAWIGLSLFELVCAVCLILPAFNKKLKMLSPIGAIGIAAEMLLFSVLHIFSGDPDSNPLIYWIIVAAICGFIVYGRMVLKRS